MRFPDGIDAQENRLNRVIVDLGGKVPSFFIAVAFNLGRQIESTEETTVETLTEPKVFKVPIGQNSLQAILNADDPKLKELAVTVTAEVLRELRDSYKEVELQKLKTIGEVQHVRN